MSIVGTERRPDSESARESAPVSAPVPDPEFGQVDLDESEPDSRMLILEYTDRDFIPTSPRYVPWSCTFGMRRATANDLAVALNRDVIHDDDREYWHIVCRRKNLGFCVLRVHVPYDWKPESEYELPPDAGITNLAARHAAVHFNKKAMREGVWKKRRWAVLVKPVQRPAA